MVEVLQIKYNYIITDDGSPSSIIRFYEIIIAIFNGIVWWIRYCTKSFTSWRIENNVPKFLSSCCLQVPGHLYLHILKNQDLNQPQIYWKQIHLQRHQCYIWSSLTSCSLNKGDGTMTDHLVTKVRCKVLPYIDPGDFSCQCAIDSSSHSLMTDSLKIWEEKGFEIIVMQVPGHLYCYILI